MKLVRLLVALLKELSDETAYARFLDGREPSGEEWRKFSDQRHRSKYARAKCC